MELTTLVPSLSGLQCDTMAQESQLCLVGRSFYLVRCYLTIYLKKYKQLSQLMQSRNLLLRMRLNKKQGSGIIKVRIDMAKPRLSETLLMAI